MENWEDVFPNLIPGYTPRDPNPAYTTMGKPDVTEFWSQATALPVILVAEFVGIVLTYVFPGWTKIQKSSESFK